MRRCVMQTFCPCLFEQIQVTNISQTQVAIIGGGLAGLHAAHLLHRAGVSFQLFEARDRLGGRILTVDEAGRAAEVGFDLGPSWFWPDMQPGLGDLVDELRLGAFAQHTDGDMLYERGLRERPHRMRGMGQEPRSMRLTGGCGALIHALADYLPKHALHLGAAVTDLRLIEAGIELTCERHGKVRMTLRPGGFDNPSQGWTGGYAKRGTTGSVYLDAEYTVLEGQYAKRKIWSLIGLFSPKGPDWANMGRAYVRSVLNSARGLSEKDNSPQAQNARRISGLADLDGLEFYARIDVGTDANGDEKNDIRSAITRDHKDYPANTGAPAPVVHAQPVHAPAPALKSVPTPQPPAPVVGVRPTWAK